MTISHGGYGFESISTHGMPYEGAYEHNPKVASFYGVFGSVEVRDQQHGREIRVDAKFSGYSTRAALQTVLDTVDTKVNLLNDETLTVTVSGDAIAFYHCTFRGFERSGPMYYDGSSVNDWQIDGTLIWYQLKRTT